jgi:hypothetical protein
MRSFSLCFVVVLLVLSASSASAGTVVYTDRATWQAAAAAAVTVETFESETPAYYHLPYTTVNGLTMQGRIDLIAILADNWLNHTKGLHFRDFAPRGEPSFQGMTLSFPGGNPMTAVGFDYNCPIENWTLRIGSWSTELWHFTSGFIGVVSSDPFFSFMLTSSANAQGGILVDNISFASARPVLEAAIDIIPARCANEVTLGTKGQIRVVVLGSDDVIVSNIVTSTVRLAGAAPRGSFVYDVMRRVDAEPCNCHDAGQDGYKDLVLTFRIEDVLASLGSATGGDIFDLVLTADTADGKLVKGEGFIRILAPPRSNVPRPNLIRK